jgi:hypothetical protein
MDDDDGGTFPLPKSVKRYRMQRVRDDGQTAHDQRIAELERVLRRVVTAKCAVERESALLEAFHVLNAK